jgi:hypothetical protein
MKTKIIFLLLFLLPGLSGVRAEEANGRQPGAVSTSLGADFVSSYIWRGTYQAGFCVQPSASLQAYGCSLSAWGSTDIAGNGHKEIILTLGYSVSGFTAALSDCWWQGEHKPYFVYDKETSGHIFEATLAYTLPSAAFPLSVTSNTAFAGPDRLPSNRRAFSTYLHLACPFPVGRMEGEVSTGLTPWKGSYADGFAVIHAGVGLSRAIRVSDAFALPVSGKIIANPRSRDFFFVFGISLNL